MAATSTEQPLLWGDRVALIVLAGKSLLGQKVDSLSTERRIKDPPTAFLGIRYCIALFTESALVWGTVKDRRRTVKGWYSHLRSSNTASLPESSPIARYKGRLEK
jgi:hypothetical protein